MQMFKKMLYRRQGYNKSYIHSQYTYNKITIKIGFTYSLYYSPVYIVRIGQQVHDWAQDDGRQ